MSVVFGDVTVSVDGPYVIVGNGADGCDPRRSFLPSALGASHVMDLDGYYLVQWFSPSGQPWGQWTLDTRAEALAFGDAIRRAAIEAGQWRRG